MTRLRKMMLEELQRRNYSENTDGTTFAQWKSLLDTSAAPRIA
jgi:fructose-bisphosphate aldolase class 1